ncbi:hypothetical protein CCACVL1_21055 [Corchorus capsularis]|uniref:non-specific serine/threonine protein kinase n=1 Tax=Corchorus capsularis TaxID=210143 RepID=A0A1R3H8E4_COCAP|nr:hypothetical protein CCACVL1_21055 [Corchorus capsularis]
MLRGAHIARLVRTPNPNSLTLLLLFSLVSSSLIVVSFAGKETETDILLTFKDSLANPYALSNWNESIQPCTKNRANWMGVVCINNTIWGLQLENMGLSGMVNMEILVGLRKIRTLSLMNNNFEGTMPNIRKLSSLRNLYLSNNRFSGEIPDDAFQGMRSLRKVLLANNGFTGKIPLSLTTLPRLMMLRLEVNQFVGQIPEFKEKSLKVVNFASNQLEGPIPASLSKQGPNIFSGNKNLCGPPLKVVCTTPPPSPSPAGTEGKQKSALTIALIVVSILLLLVVIAAIVLILSRRKQNPKTIVEMESLDDSNKLPTYDNESEKKAAAAEVTAMMSSKRSDQKLIFLKDDIEVFDLQDMLRASAEVLGSGNFGASYKADISAGAVVVKRYKQMNNVGREDFHEHMRRLGRLNHPNLLPLMAYYYRKEEKLLVAKFMENGSLASHLHANHTLEQPSLDWPTRLKIIKGVSRGLNYLYTELPSLVVPHGHLKSSNVLLDENFEPLLCDYALRPVINQERAHMLMTAYKSPEYVTSGRISKKTDVWSLGILILEVITGKFPENYLTPNYDSSTSLATWVNEMVKEKKSGEVFEKEMAGTKNSKGEMFEVLKIGLSCCEEDPETRPEMKEVVQKIEELREGDEDNIEDFSSTLGEINAYVTRGNTDQDESFYSYDR